MAVQITEMLRFSNPEFHTTRTPIAPFQIPDSVREALALHGQTYSSVATYVGRRSSDSRAIQIGGWGNSPEGQQILRRPFVSQKIVYLRQFINRPSQGLYDEETFMQELPIIEGVKWRRPSTFELIAILNEHRRNALNNGSNNALLIPDGFVYTSDTIDEGRVAIVVGNQTPVGGSGGVMGTVKIMPIYTDRRCDYIGELPIGILP